MDNEEACIISQNAKNYSTQTHFLCNAEARSVYILYQAINMLCSSPEVIKLFSCSTQLSMKFILLINVKMPTIVGILTFISMINTTFERLKARNISICQYFSFCEQLKFHAQLS